MSDTMREAFDKFFFDNFDVEFDNPCTAYFEAGYKSAQADAQALKENMQMWIDHHADKHQEARALVGELVEALASVKCDMYDTKPLDDDVCKEVESALTKAQAFMGGKL